MVRVLGRVTSINVRKVLWALDELGEGYEREDWGMPIRDPKVPEFLALNPNAQIPVLIEDDGKALWESNGLLVYLAQTRTGLLPKDRHALGLALQWLGWQASELNPSWGYVVPALLRRSPGYDDPRKIAEAITRWTGTMSILDAALEKSGPYLAGSEFSIADIAVGLSCHRWFKTPFEKREFAAVRHYYERLRGREAGERWMPEEYG